MMRPIAILVLAVSLLLPLPCCLAEGTVGLRLEILRHPEGGILWHAPVAPGDLFRLEYIHSSDGTPVRGIFQVAGDGRFVMLEEQYLWYGAGLESHPQARISFDGDWTRVAVNRPFKDLLIRVGRVSRQLIESGGSRVALTDLAPGGSLLQLRITKR